MIKKNTFTFKAFAFILTLILVFVSMYELNAHTYSSGVRNYDLHWGLLKVFK